MDFKNKYFTKIALVFFAVFIFSLGYIISGKNYIPPHYHTNFAVFIDGEKLSFTDDKYSEDVAKCSAGEEIFPKDRVHLHGNNGDTIHVHHGGVTWGHFFANNGITFSNNHISFEEGKKVLINAENKVMKFVLNGEEVKNPFNRYMLSEDKLLVSYGSSNIAEVLNELYPQIVSNAGEYNNKYDPGSCSGTNENSTLFLIKKMLHLGHH